MDKFKKPKREVKGPNDTSFSGGVLPALTSAEVEVYYMLTKDYLTASQIAARRGVGKRAINLLISSMRNKGVDLSPGSKTGVGASGWEATLCSDKKFRLHGLRYHVGVIHAANSYRESLKKSNQVCYPGYTVILHLTSLEVYCNKDFFGADIDGITRASVIDFERLLVRLQYDLKVVLMKSRARNIRQVGAHYSEVENEIAKEVKAEKIQIFGEDDGRLWFTIDNSFNLNEAECLHPSRSKEDSEVIFKKVFEPYREGEVPIPREMATLIIKLENNVVALSQAMLTMSTGLNTLLQQIGLIVKVQEVQAQQINILLGLNKEEKKESKGEEKADYRKPSYIG